MKKTHNPAQVKRLLRVLDTLDGFELVIYGYRSLPVFREMQELLRTNCRTRKIKIIDIDLSTLSQVGEFENLLQRKKGKTKGYRVFNLTGLETHIKAGETSFFLNHINLLRDRLADDLPYGFFFWLPENLVQRFAVDAPDLWAWRNTVFIFEDEARPGELAGIPMQAGDSDDFENFTLKEKQVQIRYLEDTLKTLLAKPQTLKRDKKLAEVYADLGRLYASRGSFDEAFDYLERSMAINVSIGDQEGIAYAYNNIGLIYRSRGDFELALNHFKKSLEISQLLLNHRESAGVNNNIGLMYFDHGDYETAMKAFKKSLKFIRKIGDKVGEVHVLNNIAHVLHVLGEFDRALELLEKSLTISREIGSKSAEGATLNNISQVYFARGDYEFALKSLKKSLTIRQALGDKDGESINLNNIARIYYILKNYEKAREYLEQSLSIHRKTGDLPGEAHALIKLATLYFNINVEKKAVACLKKAMEINDEIKDAGITRELDKIPKELMDKVKAPGASASFD